MDADQWPLGLPAGRGAAALGVGGLDQALIAAPAGADPEQIERGDKAVDRRLRDRLQHDAEQSACAEKISLPQRVAGIFGERRVEDARYVRPALQPARDLDCVPLMPFETDAQRAHAAQSEEDVVRPGAMAEIGYH